MQTMFEQATIPVQNEKTFAEVKQAIDAVFSSSQVNRFFGRVAGAKLRIRQFEEILRRGFLGTQARAGYAALGDSDRGQIREQYLRCLEEVPPEVRQQFFRIYASY